MVFNPVMEGKKLVYCTRNAKVVAAKDLWPELDNTDGINVLQAEHYVHDEWFPIRTSMIVDVRGNDYETRNSIYRVIDQN